MPVPGEERRAEIRNVNRIPARSAMRQIALPRVGNCGKIKFLRTATCGKSKFCMYDYAGMPGKRQYAGCSDARSRNGVPFLKKRYKAVIAVKYWRKLFAGKAESFCKATAKFDHHLLLFIGSTPRSIPRRTAEMPPAEFYMRSRTKAAGRRRET